MKSGRTMIGRVFLLAVIIFVLIILDKAQANPDCVAGEEFVNACNERCQCSSQGDPVNCTRIRREFNSMTTAERQQYVDTVYTVSTNATYKTDWDHLIHIHKELFDGFRGIHDQRNFLPWHRWFVLQYENLLRQIDCRITVSYWDWSVVSEDPWTGPIWSDDSGIGGNGTEPHCFNPQDPFCCVESGPFRREVWSQEPAAMYMCLARNFNGDMPSEHEVDNLLQETDFDTFEVGLRVDLHDTVHCLIYGTMCINDAANAPEFFLHHGFIDKIWDDWQAISDANKNAYFPSINRMMPDTEYYPRDFIDLMEQPIGVPGAVRAEYKPIPTTALRLPTGARPFPGLDVRAIRLFQTSAEEVEKANEIGSQLWSAENHGNSD